MDEMFYGGMIKGETALISGQSGTGKTLFSLQFIKEGLKRKEKCIYVSLTEDTEEILKYYDILNTDWGQYLKNKDFLFFSVKINNLGVLIPRLAKILKENKTGRIAIDGFPKVTGGNIKKVTEHILKIIKKEEVSSIITTGASETDKYFGLGESSVLSAVNSILVLQQVKKNNKVSRLITILKAKGTFHDTNVREIKVGKNGLKIKTIAIEDENEKKYCNDILKPSEVNYHIWYLDPVDNEVSKILDGFRKDNPSVVVNKSNEIEPFEQKYLIDSGIDLIKGVTKITSTHLGVLAASYNNIYNLAKEGLLTSLDGHVDKNIYLKDAVDICSFEGKIYGVPLIVNSRNLIYRKDLLDKYKLKVPETWDEVMQTGEYIKDREKDLELSPVSFFWGNVRELPGMFLELLWSNGANIYDNQGKANLNTGKALSAVKLMQKLINKYKVPEEKVHHGHSECLKKFKKGKTVFLIYSSEILEYIDWEPCCFPREKVGIAALPVVQKGNKSYSVTDGVGYCIPKNTKDVNSAIKLVKYFASNQVSKELNIKWGYPFTPEISLWADKEILNKRPYNIHAKSILKDLRNPYAEIKHYNIIENVIRERVYQILKSQKNPEITLKILSDEINIIIKRHKMYYGVAKNIEEYLINNYDKKISLKTISGKIGLSPHHIEKVFKWEVGMTVFDYITRLRLEKAKELLRDVRYNVSEITGKIGYSDAAYFCRLFKKYTKLTPTKYRLK